MRLGTLSVRLRTIPESGPIPAAPQDYLPEAAGGYVIAAPGSCYALVLTNHAPQRALVTITIDGRRMTGRGIVVPALSSVQVEGPVDLGAVGRFIALREGHEALGEDGGRDRDALGLIEVRYQKERPYVAPALTIAPFVGQPITTDTIPFQPYRRTIPSPWAPIQQHFWTYTSKIFGNQGGQGSAVPVGETVTNPSTSHVTLRSSTVGARQPDGALRGVALNAMQATLSGTSVSAVPDRATAVGTGMAGDEVQHWDSVSLGALELEETIIRLRLIHTAAAVPAAPRIRPLPTGGQPLQMPAPARPEPRA